MPDALVTPADRLAELRDLVEGIEIALLTTRRPDGHLVTRPMATQDQSGGGDLWFVTDIGSGKVDEIRHDPNVCVGYLNPKTMEWVSVSGTATISQDRARIRDLYQPDWKAWFEDEGGERDGGPDDPRLALLVVDAHEAHYLKTTASRPRILFEVARGIVTGDAPDIGREEHLAPGDLTS